MTVNAVKGRTLSIKVLLIYIHETGFSVIGMNSVTRLLLLQKIDKENRNGNGNGRRNEEEEDEQMKRNLTVLIGPIRDG
jgi:hypothetical protein